MITTSRYASKETKAEAKKLSKINSQKYVARGKKTVEELVELARRTGEESIQILEEQEKQPKKISIIKVDELGRWKWISN